MIAELLLTMVLNAEQLYTELLFIEAKKIHNKIVSRNEIYDAPKLYLEKTDIVNAWVYSDGDGSVHITRGMLLSVKNADELALVLAHELGHWVHRGRQTPYYAEYWADEYGFRAMKIAGYNKCRGAQVVWRWGAESSYSHPSSTDRYVNITPNCYGKANVESDTLEYSKGAQ